QLHRAAPAIHQGIAGQLAGRGDDLGLLYLTKRKLLGPAPHRIADPHHIAFGPDRQRLMSLDDQHRSPLAAGPLTLEEEPSLFLHSKPCALRSSTGPAPPE